MRRIKSIHRAENRPMGNLVTYSPMPSRTIDHIDPFLFLNHHGPQVYPENNNGLPFGPHPHRGMETVTFILDGDIAHKDSNGFSSVIEAGGIQWMTAGKGLIHSEVSSEQFLKNGGKLEILQLWLNLPRALKNAPPNYIGLQKDNIPTYIAEDKKSKVNIIAGEFQGVKGRIEPLYKIFLTTVELSPNAEITFNVPLENNVFLYIVKGSVAVNGKSIDKLNLVEFEHNHQEVNLKAFDNCYLLFGHAKPFKEPIVAQGPFVMNSTEEIQQAYTDYQNGLFGEWNH